MQNVFDTLKERGFIKQTVYEDELYKKLGSESMSFYIGFDPTADSLHVGHFLQLLVMSWMQKAGHRPIILIGGGTGMIGDPSGRSDLRKVMTREDVMHNCECFKKQMSKFLSFEGENAAIMVNNADWLSNLNYIDFLREIGSSFSVNKMLTAECYKQRLEKGLTFLEFNYMLMQAYDFLVLNREFGCELECGGDDQWSNMLAGVDLIRRKEGRDAYAMTFTLLTTSEGKKMGKTQKGAVWLDPEKTSPYEFFQYWRNIDDADVEKCLKLLTFLDLDEIAELVKYKDERINRAKEVLAYELTRIVHDENAAELALKQSKGAFGSGEDMPEKTISEGTVKITDILVAAGVAPSKSEARRLIEGGGIKVNDDKITDVNAEITDKEFVLHKGKKIHFRISVK
ncbi:MAG: tyrosine--tRNA ligase [Eubacteriales bacterium]|nr:tyrosine--tRNA ligase [Christensenellaceae bacterium]MDD6360691.1 tyrosine--tRNA ligase [Christensenellaceae bacterium]MDD7092065.1 tyrosine--tRNA ligase [Christensenellaceae bacterium]MDY3241671.1 tyrosine--tRNA ligase [Eubacteriales bacterium]